MGPPVSVVLPAFDEAATIESAVRRTIEACESFLPAFEVLVAEDGCSDRTPEIAARLARDDHRVRHVHSDERLGRGRALCRAFREAEGEVLVYFDTDLATDLGHLEPLVESVRSGEYDVATGSRLLPDSDADRPLSRRVASRVYNALVRVGLRSELRDHQCGFKAFDREVLYSLLPEVEDGHWFWDTEVLVRAQRQGYRIRELPVEWTPGEGTTVDPVRDVLGMGGALGRTWWGLSVRPRLTTRVSLVAGLLLVLLALAVTARYVDLGTVVSEVRAADPVLVGLAVAVYLLSWPLRGLRYRDVLAELGHREEVGFLTGVIFLSQTANVALPARAGDAVRAYVLKVRRGVGYPTGAASLAVERLFDTLTIAALATSAFLALVASGMTSSGGLSADLPAGGAVAESGRVGVIAAGGVGVLAVALCVVVLASAHSDRRFVRPALARASEDTYTEGVTRAVERFAGDVQAIARTPRTSARVGAASALIWAIDVLAAALVLRAFGVQAAPLAILGVCTLAVCVGNLAKVLPLSPGGIGLYEGAFTVLVVALLPASLPIALGAAVVDHLLKNLVTVAGGTASMLALEVSLSTAIEEGGDERVGVEH
ncbi:flippase-like domain-containing protein [Natronorarus salvus]|uniref:flippase-like domain-containing protein n=1 Tax=Natronorarus salvus TaxID=3117733 RepID=UPI002F26D245